MKILGTILTLAIMLAAPSVADAQNGNPGNRKRLFSPEEFQKNQRDYITEKAELTAQEADAFFPLFFELQKMKFDLERNARKNINKKEGEKPGEEQCRELVNNLADAEIEKAKLEKEYVAKYLKVIPASKLLRIQHAETTFQRDLMKKMMRERGNNRQPQK